MKRQTERRMNRHYQIYFLPASQNHKVDNKGLLNNGIINDRGTCIGLQPITIQKTTHTYSKGEIKKKRLEPLCNEYSNDILRTVDMGCKHNVIC